LDIPHVLVDNHRSVYDAIQYLVASGYKNIGFVTPDLDLVQLQERVQGYKDALADNSLTIDSKYIFKLPFNSEKHESVGSLKEFIKKRKKMDCIFFSTNYLGVIGLQSINELKLNVPSNLAVVSFDDNELFELYPPGITSIRQPTYEIAKAAIDLLISQLSDNALNITETKFLMPATLIKRGSTV
jgi:LacI family transcriptional regulator